MKIGILDDLSLRLGGAQLVVARMAAHLAQTDEVDLIHSGKGYTIPKLASAFDIDLSRVKERIEDSLLESFVLPGQRSTWRYLRHGLRANAELTKVYDLFIYSGHGVPPFCSARRGLVYCHFPFEGQPSKNLGTVEGCRQRHSLDRWLRLRVHDGLWKWRMRGYSTVLANSQFTAGWIERLWGREAEVLYPPVSVRIPQVEKKNVIVTVGRFIDTDTKNHALQLNLFREFLSKNSDNWRLCLIGFCTDLPQDRAYLERLRQSAEGLPVKFVVNAERKVVLDCLAEAKLFWHTTALGEEASLSPSSTEHFGIATVEAMAAACIPLVPMSGGQPEIVQHEVSGFLCRDGKALIQSSSRLARDESLRAGMAQQTKARSQQFGSMIFAQRLSQLVLRCLAV